MGQLKRAPESVKAVLVKRQDGSVFTKVDCKIHVPVRWMSVDLGVISTETRVYGFFPIILENDTYSVFKICAMLPIAPARTTIVTVNETEYYEFSFKADSVLFTNIKLVRDDRVIFPAMSELLLKGKVPWWATLQDMATLFDTADKHASSNVAKVDETIEMLASVCARHGSDLSKYLRQMATSLADYRLENVSWVPLSSVIYSVNSVMNKLAGSYFKDGVVSALVDPARETNVVERIYRA